MHGVIYNNRPCKCGFRILVVRILPSCNHTFPSILAESNHLPQIFDLGKSGFPLAIPLNFRRALMIEDLEPMMEGRRVR